jgi:hypothetical protein
MGDAAAHLPEAEPETAPAAAPAQPVAGVLAEGLSPVAVLALQRSAGNRVARAAITRSTSARVLARKPVKDECADMQVKLNDPSNQPHSAALRKEAIALAGKAFATYQSSKNDDDLDGCKRVLRGLASAGGDSAKDALDFAKAKADKDVASAVLGSVPMGKNAAGQQDLMVDLGRLVGVAISGPTAGQSAGAWLDANTSKIGEALKKVDAAGWISAPSSDSTVTQTSLHFASNLLKKYFNFDINLPDIVPDKMGKVAGLQFNAGENKIEADCDVWAAYGMQLFKAMGWTPVGYMSIIPTDTSRAGHAVALLKRPASTAGKFEYLLGSDWFLKTITAATDEDAKRPLLDHGLEIYASPRPSSYSVYFLPCPISGEYDKRILDPVNNRLTPWKAPP